MGASSRYRFFQYFPLLEKAGIRCSAAPLFDSAYLSRRYAEGKGSLDDLFRAFWRRLKAISRARRHTLLVIEYELIPYAPALLERLLAVAGIPYIVEYDDAIFDHYERSRFWPVRTFLSKKIGVVMRSSRLVVTGNRYLAAYAEDSGAREVEVIPTVIDLARYPLSPPAENGCFTIGWIGSPSTASYLEAVAGALAAVCRGGRGKLVLIGSGAVELPGVPVEVLPWSAETEVAEISRFDVGIMPLPESSWALGKCGFKLIQYMGCALPVVASPVGVNSSIVREGENGLLARGEEEWIGALERLQQDPELGRRMGRRGRELVERQYCREVTAPRLISLIEKVAGEAR